MLIGMIHRLQNLQSVSLPQQKSAPVAAQNDTKAVQKLGQNAMRTAAQQQPGFASGANDALIVQLQHRIAVLEAEAKDRRQFDDLMLRSLRDVSEVALATDRYFSQQNGSQLTIKIGQASIVLKSNGEISIKGTTVEVKGTVIDIKGSGDVKIKGPKIGQN